MSQKSYIIVAIVVVVLIGGLTAIGLTTQTQTDNGKYDTFATCLAEKGVTFFGAFWCPHCRAQKALFGSSVDKLPYHECSTADAQGQLQDCTDKGIESYPTWIYADGTRDTGEQTLEHLAEKSGCMLPGSTGTSTPGTSSSTATTSQS